MKSIIRIILTIAFAIASLTGVRAAEPHLQASLLTCYPGPEVYELCGHEAIRIRGIDQHGLPVDSVWNYGVFDFNSPNFIFRFVKGETDYMVWGCPYSWFIPQYIDRGSKVVEQDLNLTPIETLTLRRLLQINSQPRNRTYRYNYVRDNCSTRVADMIDAAVEPRKIIYPDSVSFKSFRDAMRYYHRNYPWYQFGIDLALGAGIDLPITSREEMFAPLLLEQKVAAAHFEDGPALLKRSIVLNPGQENAVLPPTPWWQSPMAVSLLIMLFSFAVAGWEWWKSKIVKWWMTIFFSILGLAGCVVWFLVFSSSHEATSPNILFLWLNPLQLVVATMIWWRLTRPLAMAMTLVNLIVMIVLVGAWPLQPQSANPAIFPLWAATIALSAAYAIIYPRSRYHNGSITKVAPRRRNTARSTRNSGKHN